MVVDYKDIKDVELAIQNHLCPKWFLLLSLVLRQWFGCYFLKYHPLFILKIRKDVAQIVFCCSRDWRFKG